jgi:Alcohol dehydrogenase GroES-like domain
MQAMVLNRPGERLRLAELPTPEPAAGQILVRVKACAVCRTDLHVVDGELPEPKLPIVPGHEIVGEVARTGRGVDWVPRRRARRHPLARLHLRQMPLLRLRPGEPVRCGPVHRLPDRWRLRRIRRGRCPLLLSDPPGLRRP